MLLYNITEVASNISSFTTEDTNVTHTNIAIIYNQYLIRPYLENILKCHAAKLGFARSMLYGSEEGGAQRSRSKS
jgi:hypothetical protein